MRLRVVYRTHNLTCIAGENENLNCALFKYKCTIHWRCKFIHAWKFQKVLEICVNWSVHRKTCEYNISASETFPRQVANVLAEWLTDIFLYTTHNWSILAEDTRHNTLVAATRLIFNCLSPQTGRAPATDRDRMIGAHSSSYKVRFTWLGPRVLPDALEICLDNMTVEWSFNRHPSKYKSWDPMSIVDFDVRKQVPPSISGC